MRKWEALAKQTYDDINKRKIQEKKHAENDCTAVIIDNIFKIRKRTGRG